MITLSIDQTIRLILERGVDVRLVDGQLCYRGPRLAPDDPLAVALGVHRDELIRMLTSAPRRWPCFEPGPPYFEPLGPNTWRETAWSGARCIHGDAPLAPGDRLHCPAHAVEYAAATGAEPVARWAPVSETVLYSAPVGGPADDRRSGSPWPYKREPCCTPGRRLE